MSVSNKKKHKTKTMIPLHDYGYSTKKTDKDRKKAIQKAMQENEPALVMDRLKRLQNYQSLADVKKVFDKDTKYAEKIYKKYTQAGGQFDDGDDSLRLGGTTKKTYLPRLDKKEVRLGDYGYSTSESIRERQKALDRASNATDALLVYRYLNYIRNVQPHDSLTRDIMNNDVEYMITKYRAIREKYGPAPGSYAERKQLGGELSAEFQWDLEYNQKLRMLGGKNKDVMGEPSTDSDTIVSNIRLPEEIIVSVETEFKTKEVCNREEKCKEITIMRESHTIDETKILFYTLDTNDADSVLILDRDYLDSDQTKAEVLDKLEKEYGYLIGIKVDDKLQGYCEFKPIITDQQRGDGLSPFSTELTAREESQKETVKIVWFCANKGYGTPLFIFMQKFFIKQQFWTIVLTVSLEGSYAVRRLNFWYDKGFTAYESKPGNKQILMEKKI